MLIRILLVMFLCGVAAAQDADSPRAAMTQLWSAVQRDDADAVMRLTVVENDVDQKLAAAYARFILAGKSVGDALKQKFPGTVSALASAAPLPDDIAKIDSARVTAHGNEATLSIADHAEPVRLLRVDGVWRVIVGDSQVDRPDTQHVALVEAMTDAMRSCAVEIIAEKYHTAHDAENAVKQRLGTVLSKAMQGDLPTSRPTTQENQTADEHR